MAEMERSGNRAPLPNSPKSPVYTADVGIALLLLCDRIGLDLADTIRDKVAKNGIRYPVEASRGRAERPPG